MNAVASVQGSQEVSRLLPRERRKQPLRASVQLALERFFQDLDGHIWELVHLEAGAAAQG